MALPLQDIQLRLSKGATGVPERKTGGDGGDVIKGRALCWATAWCSEAGRSVEVLKDSLPGNLVLVPFTMVPHGVRTLSDLHGGQIQHTQAPREESPSAMPVAFFPTPHVDVTITEDKLAKALTHF